MDCNDSNSVLHGVTKRYKDTDNDGYSDGTTITQCASSTGYKLAANLTALTGDCDETNMLINPVTTRYLDADADGYSEGTTQTGCTDPGATYYLARELLATASTNSPLLTTGLVVRYLRSGANGNDSASSPANLGALGGPSYAPGLYGYAGKFDGVDDRFYTTAAKAKLTGHMSISLYLKSSFSGQTQAIL